MAAVLNGLSENISSNVSRHERDVEMCIYIVRIKVL
jgi:hypothetical protein